MLKSIYLKRLSRQLAVGAQKEKVRIRDRQALRDFRTKTKVGRRRTRRLLGRILRLLAAE